MLHLAVLSAGLSLFVLCLCRCLTRRPRRLCTAAAAVVAASVSMRRARDPTKGAASGRRRAPLIITKATELDWTNYGHVVVIGERALALAWLWPIGESGRSGERNASGAAAAARRGDC